MPEILLHTKLGVPPQREVVVARKHLLDYINAGFLQAGKFSRKLTLVSAPAGYGKTTFVAEWLHRLQLPAGWLSLDEGDNDPNRFLAYLMAAIQIVRPGVGASAQAMIQSPQPPPAEISLTILINEINALSGSLILVLDDYQAINNISIHQQVTFLLEHLPAQMHLVLITREDPLIPVPRLRARSQVLEIRQEDLRFTLEEITDFMRRVMQLDLSQDDILALERRTEGWVAGLQLAALSLHGLRDKSDFILAFTGSNRYILDYLIEEVFNRQPGEVRDFLLKTAILDRLSGPLCDALVGRSGSRELLEKLEQANMFIVPLDPSRTWYRYHRLFSELLRHQQQLVRLPVEVTRLHQRASQWFEGESYLNEAIQHSLAAQDWAKAAYLIGQVNDGMFKRGEIVTLINWMEALPNELILSQTGLCMIYGWALLLVGRYDQARPVLAQAENLASTDPALLGQVATAQAYLARSVGDNPGVIERSQLALSLLPEGDHSVRGTLSMNLGMVYWHEGHLDEAEPVLEEARENAVLSGNLYVHLTSEIFMARTNVSHGKIRQAALHYPTIIQRGTQVPVVSLAYLDLGSLHYEWDDLEKSEQYLEQGLELSLRTRNVEFQIAGLILQTYLSLARQDFDGASGVMDRACKLASDFSLQTRARCAACQALIAIAQGDLQSADRWMEQNPINLDSHPFYRFLGLNLPRLLIARGRMEQAAEQLRNSYESASTAGWGYGLVAVRVLQALSANAPKAGHEFLGDALRRAEPEGYIRTFVDAGIGLIPLLEDIAREGITPDYIGRILTAFGSKIRLPAAQAPLIAEPLSEREIEVLRLVAAGLSNREIAGRLYISPGTAKTHVHHLCGKLGVRNRTEAATRAKELGLA